MHPRFPGSRPWPLPQTDPLDPTPYGSRPEPLRARIHPNVRDPAPRNVLRPPRAPPMRDERHLGATPGRRPPRGIPPGRPNKRRKRAGGTWIGIREECRVSGKICRDVSRRVILPRQGPGTLRSSEARLKPSPASADTYSPKRTGRHRGCPPHRRSGRADAQRSPPGASSAAASRHRRKPAGCRRCWR